MKIACILLMVLSALVLLTYPFVMMANLMGIAAMPMGGSMPVSTQIAAYTFMISSSIYPLAFLAGLIGTLVNLRKNLRAALFWQLGVVAYLAAVGMAMAAWLFLG